MQVGEMDEYVTSLRSVIDVAAWAPAFVVVRDNILLSGDEQLSGGRV
jgi:hypothetical protein